MAPLALYWLLPFAILLLAIAVLPLGVPHWWEDHRHKLLMPGAGFAAPPGRWPTQNWWIWPSIMANQPLGHVRADSAIGLCRVMHRSHGV